MGTGAVVLCGLVAAWGIGQRSAGKRPGLVLLPGQSSWHACELLSEARAQQFVGPVDGPWRASRIHADQENCTYVKRDATTSVSVATYPAAEFERTVSTLTRGELDPAERPRAAQLLGRRAAFQRRLGYLVKVRGAPVWVQFTFMHVSRLHADPKLSRRLADEVLRGVLPLATRRKLYCSLTGERVL